MEISSLKYIRFERLWEKYLALDMGKDDIRDVKRAEVPSKPGPQIFCSARPGINISQNCLNCVLLGGTWKFC